MPTEGGDALGRARRMRSVLAALAEQRERVGRTIEESRRLRARSAGLRRERPDGRAGDRGGRRERSRPGPA